MLELFRVEDDKLAHIHSVADGCDTAEVQDHRREEKAKVNLIVVEILEVREEQLKTTARPNRDAKHNLDEKDEQ